MKTSVLCLLLACAFVANALAGAPQLEEFSYQGRLQLNGQPADGTFPMTFTLYTASSGGNTVGVQVSQPSVTVSGGSFGVSLSYPGAFTGQQLWLEIAVNGQILASRQAITAAPVAQFALAGGRLLDYNETSPSTSMTPPVTFITTVSPFDFYGECTLNSNTGAVTLNPQIFSNDTYDVRATKVAQTNDTGATTTTFFNDTNVTTMLAGPALTTVTSGNYMRMLLTLVLHSRSRPSTVTVTAYLAVDARAASTGCAIQGTATLGL